MFSCCNYFFKVFGKVKHRGKVVGYDPITNLYKIVYDNDDTEQYFHNEVRDQQKRSFNKRRQWRKSKSANIHYLNSKYAPKELDYVEHVISLTVETARYIASLRFNVDIPTKDVIIEMIKIVDNASQSNSITPKEAATGHYTRSKLKKLTTWNELKKGEHKQMNQFHDQKMFGDAIDPVTLPKNAIILQPHWNYVVKISGMRSSRQCCNGS